MDAAVLLEASGHEGRNCVPWQVPFPWPGRLLEVIQREFAHVKPPTATAA